MSRTRRFAHSLISGYALLGVNILFTLVQGRMLLHYITTDNEVGLWAVAIQVAGYFLLLDMGMSGSIGRILIDHKDDRTSTAYGSTIKTGFTVLLIQGGIIALGGILVSRWLPELMQLDRPTAAGSVQRIPLSTEQIELFRSLVMWQCILIGIAFSGRLSGFIMEAHQRYDVSNYIQTVGFLVNLGTLWWCFEQKLGLYSLLWSNAANYLWTHGCSWFAVWRLRFLPTGAQWGTISWARFRELFGYATDVFFLAVGNMLITASQVVVVGWTLGLVAAGVWSFTTKAFTMAYQLIGRIYNYSSAPLAEMLVRGETERLRTRVRDLVILSTGLAVWVALGAALCNASFLRLWTQDRMAWNAANDFLMATYIIIFTVTRWHIGLASLAKQLRLIKYVYFAEGFAFVLLAALLGRWLGFPGIILGGIFTNLFFSGLCGFRKTADTLAVPLMDVALGWMRRPGLFFVLMLVVAVVARFALAALPPGLQLSLQSLLILGVGCVGLWTLALPKPLQRELRTALEKFRKRLTARN